jgi:hypothetical protein
MCRVNEVDYGEMEGWDGENIKVFYLLTLDFRPGLRMGINDIARAEKNQIL